MNQLFEKVEEIRFFSTTKNLHFFFFWIDPNLFSNKAVSLMETILQTVHKDNQELFNPLSPGGTYMMHKKHKFLSTLGLQVLNKKSSHFP